MKHILAKLWKLFGLPKNIQLFAMRRLQDQFLVGVTGIIFNNKNEILLFKHVYRAHSWSLPGGYMKAGEHPREGVER
ncbi:NUDIX hydrolase, partial [Candidatus Woesebacteria bacterium]|nr:NUDIX hydrolase [Candidatus Woesebacteria bacterium]